MSFENRYFPKYDIHVSRIIASWRNAGGRYFDEEFKAWLTALGFDQDTIRYIVNMATCGKLELEMSAKIFLKAHPEED